jgi:hypothetical protein
VADGRARARATDLIAMQLRNVEEVTLDLTIDGYGAMSELVEAGKVRYLDISGRRSSASGAPTPRTRSARCRRTRAPRR